MIGFTLTDEQREFRDMAHKFAEKTIRPIAAEAGAADLNSLKPWNRCGMGRCQGRFCGPVAAQLVAAETGMSVESAGTFKARIPIKPVPLAVVGAVEEARPTGTAMEDHVGYRKAVVR